MEMKLTGVCTARGYYFFTTLYEKGLSAPPWPRMTTPILTKIPFLRVDAPHGLMPMAFSVLV
jgi:hypothetical protein